MKETDIKGIYVCDSGHAKDQRPCEGHGPKHWRDRAKEASAIADEMKDPDAKQAMLGIARNYVLLAERAEARAKGSPQSK